jgi:FKBP-type peptidyl-prolyl cis-trans isomerase
MLAGNSAVAPALSSAMNTRIIRFLPLLLTFAALGRAADQPATPPQTFSQETYADLGAYFGENGKFSRLGWTDAEFDSFVSGLRDSFHGKAHNFDARAQALRDETTRRLQQVAQAEQQKRREFFKDPARVAKFMNDSVKAYKMELAPSGLAYLVQSQKSNIRPKPADTVVISCRVRAADARTELPQLALDHKSVKVSELLPGVAEGIQMLTAGSAMMLIVPPDLSYGKGTWPQGVDAEPLFYLITLDQVVPGK